MGSGLVRIVQPVIGDRVGMNEIGNQRNSDRSKGLGQTAGREKPSFSPSFSRTDKESEGWTRRQFMEWLAPAGRRGRSVRTSTGRISSEPMALVCYVPAAGRGSGAGFGSLL